MKCVRSKRGFSLLCEEEQKNDKQGQNARKLSLRSLSSGPNGAGTIRPPVLAGLEISKFLMFQSERRKTLMNLLSKSHS